jgi:hypothetical protein
MLPDALLDDFARPNGLQRVILTLFSLDGEMCLNRIRHLDLARELQRKDQFHNETTTNWSVVISIEWIEPC